ncbi:MAG: hypothetical protein ACXIT9_00145 [Nitritalea sp.]
MQKIDYFLLCTLLWLGLNSPSLAQLDILARIEQEVKPNENPYLFLPMPSGLIGFREYNPKPFTSDTALEYFVTDRLLERDTLVRIPLPKNHNLLGFDSDNRQLYLLFQKGDFSMARYMLRIDLNSHTWEEYPLENLYEMEMREFFAFGGKVMFMGMADLRPVIQLFDPEDASLITVQGIYAKETQIVHLRKDPELDMVDILLSNRDRRKRKVWNLLSVDAEGNRLRDVRISGPENSDLELIDGNIGTIRNYQQSIIGPYGKRRTEAYRGLAKVNINEFGEYSISYLNIEDMPEFYNYLKPAARKTRLRSLERQVAKEKMPTIRSVYTTREIQEFGDVTLIYTENFNANYSRFVARDGAYANHMFMSRPYFGAMPLPMHYGGYRQFGSPNVSQFKYNAAHFILIDADDNILWNNSIDLKNTLSLNANRFGEVAFDGERLFFVYVQDDDLIASYMENGEWIAQDIKIELEHPEEGVKIQRTREETLRLNWWYEDVFLLSGVQSVRRPDENGREKTTDMYFISTIRLQADALETKMMANER